MLRAARRIITRERHLIFFVNKPLHKGRHCCDLRNIILVGNIQQNIISTESLIKDGGRMCFVGRGFSSSGYPSHIVVRLPALSPTMEKGTVVTWSKKEGDPINEGDVIAEIETDKATMAVESDDSGFIAKILVNAGTVVKIGTPICIVVDNRDKIPAFNNYKLEDSGKAQASTTAEVKTPPRKTPDSGPAVSRSASPSSPTRLEQSKPTPTARKPSIDFNKFQHLKREIVKTPTKKPSKLTPQPKETELTMYTDHPVTNIRSVIAKRLVQSNSELPQFFLSMEVDTHQLEAVRKVLNTELFQSGMKISVNDFIVKAAALSCKQVPEANSSWMDKYIRQYETVDVSVAVSTPTGLITPIVFNADVKLLREISQEIKDLARRARQGKLKPQEFQGGTFTVSNLGMFGVNSFSAIINPPQSCNLAVGTSVDKVFMRDTKISSIGVKKLLTVTLCCDHRVIDGAEAAHWLQAFKHFIEEPKNMF